MGVDLGGRNIRMPKHLLNRPQVGPAFQQIAGKGVAQHMRRNLAEVEAASRRQGFKFYGEMLACQAAARPMRGKQPFCFSRLLQGQGFEIGLKNASGPVGNRHEPFPAAFALDRQKGIIRRNRPHR